MEYCFNSLYCEVLFIAKYYPVYMQVFIDITVKLLFAQRVPKGFDSLRG